MTTVATFLDALRRLPFGTLADLTQDEPFLVLSPHPDDETLGCGGLIATAVAARLSPHVAILTDGSGSHPRSKRYPSERLVALRRQESCDATARLGLPREALHFLDLKDAAAPCEGPAFDSSVATLLSLARSAKARSLFVTFHGDPHCDHEAAFRMAEAAARYGNLRLWSYPIWVWHRDPKEIVAWRSPEGWRFDVSAAQAAKAHALQSYASQMTRLIDDDPQGFCFTPSQLEPFLGNSETFLRVRL